MSLKVWLPLDGDLRNLGTSDIEVTNNGATVDNAGKIGKCYSFDGTNDYIVGTYQATTNISFCCWVNFPTVPAGRHLFDARTRSGVGYQPMFINTSSIQIGGSGSSYSNISYSWVANTWYHICVTHNQNNGKLYINGDLIATTTAKGFEADICNFTLGSRCNQSNYCSAKINDVRIYDHCLSAAEVKEIAQGLVVHYKLDDLTNGIIDSSGYGHNGSILNVVSTSSDTSRYSSSINLSAANSMINCGRGGMVTDSITVNLWLKSSAWANPVSCTESGGWNFEASGNYFRFPVNISSVGYKYGRSNVTKAQLCDNQWHMLTGVYDRINGHIKIYVDGELDNDYNADTTNTIKYHSSNVIWIGGEATGSATVGSNGMVGLFSDFRIYCTPLSDDDIKSLYNTSMKIDNSQNIHTFELNENGENIFSSTPWTDSYGNHTQLSSPFINYNNLNEPQFTANGTSAGSNYIIITPGVYEYDYTISVNTGNQFYIGFERYDENKTSRPNTACVYTWKTKPTTDIVKQRYKGTVDLSTDGVNPIKYIALRILNGWSGTTSGVTGEATIHNFSLRLKSAAINPSIQKKGILISDEFKEYIKASFYLDHIVEANELIER